ncbi:MAG: hypothetical protein PHH16_00100 [Candidatus Gracilibacteria bacterium]|nr:hypothetical protein [Candidatus Gracilibacteria bacterium]
MYLSQEQAYKLQNIGEEMCLSIHRSERALYDTSLPEARNALAQELLRIFQGSMQDLVRNTRGSETFETMVSDIQTSLSEGVSEGMEKIRRLYETIMIRSEKKGMSNPSPHIESIRSKTQENIDALLRILILKGGDAAIRNVRQLHQEKHQMLADHGTEKERLEKRISGLNMTLQGAIGRFMANRNELVREKTLLESERDGLLEEQARLQSCIGAISEERESLSTANEGLRIREQELVTKNKQIMERGRGLFHELSAKKERLEKVEKELETLRKMQASWLPVFRKNNGLETKNQELERRLEETDNALRKEQQMRKELMMGTVAAGPELFVDDLKNHTIQLFNASLEQYSSILQNDSSLQENTRVVRESFFLVQWKGRDAYATVKEQLMRTRDEWKGNPELSELGFSSSIVEQVFLECMKFLQSLKHSCSAQKAIETYRDIERSGNHIIDAEVVRRS